MEDNLVLDGTDKDSANAGFHISYETNLNEQSGIQIGDISNLSIADLVEIDTIGFTEPAGTLKTNEGGIVFEQSSAADEFVLETYLQFITEDGDFFDLETETDTGYLIGSGTGYAAHNINIVLDGQLNRGEKLLTEGSKIEFEDNTNKGSIPEGNFGNSNITQFTREARIGSDTSTNRLSLQDEYEIGLNFALENEVGNIILDGTSAVLDVEDNIILDGTDSGKSNAGDGLVLDTAADENDNLLLDSSGGRDLGDKLVMFDTVRNQVADNEGGFFLLDGTDSSSTNAGDELLLEIKNDGTGTLQFLKQNTINIANGLPSESGGLNLPVLESDTGDGSAVITTLDSTVGTFDSTQTTFDAA